MNNEFFNRHRWWITRTLALPVHVAGFATFAFFMVRLVPGDPVLSSLDTTQTITQADYDRVAASMGLDGSIWQQLGRFWSDLIRLDLGISVVTGRSIWEEIWTRLPATLELVFLGLGGAVALSLVLAAVLLHVQSGVLHKALRGYARMAGAIPDFALAILGLVLFYSLLQVVPAPIGRVDAGMVIPEVTGFPLLDCVLTGYWQVLGSMLGHLVLPVGVMIAVYTPIIWKQFALGLDEAAASAATLFRIASGATRAAIYLSILRRAAASAVVMVGAMFGALVGGVVVLQQLFSFGGLGQFAVDSVNSIDFLGLQGFLVVLAAVSMVAFFIVDIVNMLLDPRRRPGASTEV
ncbi:ABC transporter permease [Saccharopolyspora sp. K220]|uniref:ABC transporter permease n=1 Tax=Saccharopolyspora soli TaxID=2926618 RepID=UPI001F576052|nr:ABC transporter permease [Saccharopolyspora soli]MCI2422621.1 ABC transporter permease [Saccharopolyspora soli]